MFEDLKTIERQIAEEEAESLEAYRRGIAEAPVMYKAGGHFVETKDGTPLFLANEETEDRMGDVIQVKGWDLENYKANPVILFQHRHDIAPIGTAPQVFVKGNALMNTVEFDEPDPFAAMISGKVKRNVMRAESVGFRVIEFEKRESSPGAEQWRDGFLFTNSELLEISIVSVPAHPAALRRAMGEAGHGKFFIVMPEMPKMVDIDPDLVELETITSTASIPDPIQEAAFALKAVVDEYVTATREFLALTGGVSVTAPTPEPEPVPAETDEITDGDVEDIRRALAEFRTED